MDKSESVALLSSQEKVSGLAFSMCSLAALFYCFEYYLRVAPSVMSVELKSAFLLSDAAFGNLAACYYYAYMPMQIPVGMMFDRFGSRRILTLASFLCVLGTYLFTAMHSIYIAQFGRFLIGFGSAFAYVGVLKITDVWLPQKYFALMAGVATSLGMFGAVSGELIMAYLVERIGWQSTSYGSMMFGVILTGLLWIILRDAKQSEPLFEKHLTYPKEKVQELRIIQGLLKIVKNKQMWLVGIIGCLTYLPLSAFAELWAVPFLESVGYTRSEAALGSSMVFLGFAIGAPFWGVLSDVIKGRRMPLILGSIVSAILMFLVIQYPSQTSFWMHLALFFCSFAASSQILVFAIGNDINPSGMSATAIAFINMVVMSGGVVLPPLIGKFLDNSGEDYTLALMILPIGLIASGIICLFLKESYQDRNNKNNKEE